MTILDIFSVIFPSLFSCIGLPPSFSSAKALSDFPTFTFISLSYLSDTNRAPSLFCIVCTIFRGLSSYYMPSSVFSP